jgi:GDP-L-fucose synthase
MGPSVLRGKRVLVTGASGFVGSNLVPRLAACGCQLSTPPRQEYDLLDQLAVQRLFADTRPEIVFHLAGRVGGIVANRNHPADFSYENLLMGTLMIEAARRAGVAKYITLIGGCSYPSNAPNPIAEDQLWNGYPDASAAPYALAKRMNVVLAQAYRHQHGLNAVVLVPGNIYGPYDNFDLESSHVIPALLRKFDEARAEGRAEVVAWGSGRPVRDFVYIEDACEAILRASETYDGDEIVNLSSGRPVTIRELVETVAEVCGYSGRIVWDTSKPDGQMLKAFDVTRMRERLGYECGTSLRDGLAKTLAWFREHRGDLARLDVRV